MTSCSPISVFHKAQNRLVTILNLPPPRLRDFRNWRIGASNSRFKIVPGRYHVIEAPQSRCARRLDRFDHERDRAVVHPKPFHFTDNAATNYSRRYYRAREL